MTTCSSASYVSFIEGIRKTPLLFTCLNSLYREPPTVADQFHVLRSAFVFAYTSKMTQAKNRLPYPSHFHFSYNSLGSINPHHHLLFYCLIFNCVSNYYIPTPWKESKSDYNRRMLYKLSSLLRSGSEP